MQGLFDDWQAKGITSVLHEKSGGYANNSASMRGLAAKAEGEGVRIVEGVEVTGFEFGHNSRAVTALAHRAGPDRLRLRGRRRGPVDQPHLEHARPARDLTIRAATASSMTASRCGRSGASRRGRSASTPTAQDQRRADAAGHPCRHRCAALFRHRRQADHRQAVGPLLQAGLQFRRHSGRRRRIWSEKPGRGARSIPTARQSRISSSAKNSSTCGARCWRFCQKRFEGKYQHYREGEVRRDRLLHARQLPGLRRVPRQLSMSIADSNHGYKMLGVGELVAEEIARRRAARCSSRSAFRAMPRAGSIRCRGARSPGAECSLGSNVKRRMFEERSAWPPTMRNSPRRKDATS